VCRGGEGKRGRARGAGCTARRVGVPCAPATRQPRAGHVLATFRPPSGRYRGAPSSHPPVNPARCSPRTMYGLRRMTRQTNPLR